MESTRNGLQQLNDNSAPVVRIDPPAPQQNSIKEPFKFVAQIALLVVALLPIMIWNFIEQFLLSRKKSVKGKVVLITGSGRGIGQGLAREFAKLGCKVACVDVDEELNIGTVKELNREYPDSAKAYKCNITVTREVKELKKAVIADFGMVNILINNAGLITGARLTDFDDTLMNGVIGVNLTSHFITIREFLPDMIKRNEGHIVAVSSITAFVAGPNYSFYCATKSAIIGLMNSLRLELDENPNNKVQTTTVCPWFVNTSALYQSIWNLRIPPISIEYLVDKTVDGILRNKRIFSVPYFWNFLLITMQLLPDRVVKIIRTIFYGEASIPPREIQLNTVPYRVMYQSATSPDTEIGISDKN